MSFQVKTATNEARIFQTTTRSVELKDNPKKLHTPVNCTVENPIKVITMELSKKYA